MAGVSSVSWVPRGKAWAKYRLEHPGLTQGIDNPFPDSLKVNLSDLEKADQLEDEIRALPAVDPSPDGVRRLAAEQRLIEQLIKLLGWLSSAGILLLAIAGILIFNTIRLAILSRRIEIRIMQLVGASRLTMGIPFLLEGLLQGLVGGILAALFVWATYGTIGYRLHQSLDLTWPPFPATSMAVILAGVGAGFGALCSLLALRVRHQG
jgi:cell division transport system permease protein